MGWVGIYLLVAGLIFMLLVRRAEESVTAALVMSLLWLPLTIAVMILAVLIWGSGLGSSKFFDED